MDQSRTGHLVQLPHFADLPIHKESYAIPPVNIKDSGGCQRGTEHTVLSNSMKLQVSHDRLLLQAERSEFMEGDTMILRYHSWKSKRLHKVTYDYNDKALKFDNQTFNCTVFQVNHAHNGSYHEILPSIRNYSNQCQRREAEHCEHGYDNIRPGGCDCCNCCCRHPVLLQATQGASQHPR
uniref:low affinity immunoglobulin gamma Fc region receptor II-b-like n=1 Tax=Phascolarctos cinereus TaxID=38626 RepID=UPI000A28CB28|nr:low affinity immunoglobulin gamma Fc region receptor II-b-like [Phascolarctos cinereus]